MGSMGYCCHCSRGSDMGQDFASAGFRSRAYSLARWANEAAIQTVAVAQVILATAAVILMFGVMDRTPPITLVSVEPAAARAGAVVTIRARVNRDLSRDCSADFSKYIFGKTIGTFPLPVESRFVIGAQSASPEMIRSMERTWPGGLVVSERIPLELMPGPARLIADITYRCNKGHTLWPVIVNMTLPFTVLP